MRPTASFAYNSCISVEHLARLIVEAQPCVVLTGAGVSTESGIPDFRSQTGIWTRYDPMEYATIDAFRRDPAKVWDFYSKRLGVLTDARPNAAHRPWPSSSGEASSRRWSRRTSTGSTRRLDRGG